MFRIKRAIIKFSSYYQLDLRALALLRVALAIVILLDLWIRGNDLEAFYSNIGFLPSRLVCLLNPKPGTWSLCSVFDNFNWTVFLFVVNIVFAITFLLGYKTRLSNLVLWLVTVSFQNRNLYILQGGDDLLRLLLFCGLFLPWQHYWSIDKKQKTNLLSDSLGKMSYLLLIASVYFFSACLKSSAQWHLEGSAIYHALSIDSFRTKWGNWLYQFPSLMKYCTWLVYYLELIIPVLILWPSKKGRLRLVAFILIVILHLSIGSFLNVGLFFIICIVAALGLMPKEISQKIIQQKAEPKFRSAFKYKNEITALKNGFALICIYLCLFINLSHLTWFSYKPKKELLYLINFLRLDQYWGMFSPSVPLENKWMVYYANNAKGQQYDLQNDKEYVDFKKPSDFGSLYRSDRWRKLSENIQNDEYAFLRPHFCRYTLKKWNEIHFKNKMNNLTLYSMEETILPNYKSTLTKKKLLCICDEH